MVLEKPSLIFYKKLKVVPDFVLVCGHTKNVFIVVIGIKSQTEHLPGLPRLIQKLEVRNSSRDSHCAVI